jgi:hypothetical protein
MNTTQAVGEVVNVGNTEEITIEGLAHRVKQRTGSSLRLNTYPTIRPTSPVSRT